MSHRSHSWHVKEPFPLFTSHFLPICFSSKLPFLIVWVGSAERKGAIPLSMAPSPQRDHSRTTAPSFAPSRKKETCKHSQSAEKQLFTESLKGGTTDCKQGWAWNFHQKINTSAQGELSHMGIWHPQAALLIKRRSAARVLEKRETQENNLNIPALVFFFQEERGWEGVRGGCKTI